MESEAIIRPGVVFYTTESSNGSLSMKQAVSIQSSSIYRLVGNSNTDSVLALTDKGVYDLLSDTYITEQAFSSFSCGYTFCVGSTVDGAVYSWGEGRYGELGQGSAKVMIQQPSQISVNSRIITVVTGDNYSYAQNFDGGVFLWGQNFDKQLGLYLKKLNVESYFATEDLVYIPKMLPLSNKTPIRQIACGPNFTVCLSKSGSIYSWGAGESGQLGTGRCTNREIPEQIILHENEVSAAVGVACGRGHVIALCSNGKMYSWGLNTHGQLGLGHTKAMDKPCEITMQEEDNVNIPFILGKSIFADGYSSAFIDRSGLLYTWGSTAHQRLMHPESVVAGKTHIPYPLRVLLMEGNFIESMAFAKKSSAFIIRSLLYSVTPDSGPQKSMSQLTVNGCGFYESDNTIVKFSSRSGDASRTAPRSCLGKYVSPTQITCKPPKLSDYGDFDVSVSLCGKVFIPDAIPMKIYKDFSITDVHPRIIDGRKVVDHIIPVQLFCKHMTIENAAQVHVKFVISIYRTNRIEAPSEVLEIYADGLAHPIDEIYPGYIFTAPASGENEFGHNTPLSPTLSPNPSRPETAPDADTKIVLVSLNLRDIGSEFLDPVTSNMPVMIIQAQVSVNGIDYSHITNKHNSMIYHTCNPLSLSPSCLPTDAPKHVGFHSGIQVHGNSFIPGPFLPKTVEICASLKVSQCEFMDNSSQTSGCLTKVMSEWEGIIGVRSIGSFFDMGLRTTSVLSQIELFVQAYNTCDERNKMNQEEDDEYTPNEEYSEFTLGDIRTAVLTIDFFIRYKPKYRPQGATSPYATEATSIESLKLHLYSPTPLRVEPKLWRARESLRGAGQPFKVTIISDTTIPFKSSKARIAIRNSAGESPESIVAYIDEVLFEEVVDEPIHEVENSLSKSELFPPSATAEEIIDAAIENSSVIDNGKRYSLSFVVPSIDILYPTPPSSETSDDKPVDTLDTKADETEPSTKDQPVLPAIVSDNRVYLDLQIDGRTPSPSHYQCIINLVGDINITTPIPMPKGGAVPKARIVMEVTGISPIIPKDAYFIRIRGSTDKVVVLQAELEQPSDSIDTSADNSIKGNLAFTLPDASAFAGMKPDAKSKEKKYFIDISIDGGQTFDMATVSTLPLKLS